MAFYFLQIKSRFLAWLVLKAVHNSYGPAPLAFLPIMSLQIFPVARCLHEPENQPRSPPVSARGLPPLALHASYSFKTQPQFPCRSSPVFSLHPSPLLLSGAGGQHLDGATSPRTLV